MIDFDALVLSPAMDTFAVPVMVDPVVSQPGQLPYSGRAVFTSRPLVVIYGQLGRRSYGRAMMAHRGDEN